MPIFVGFLILDEHFAVLIDTKVCEMDESLFYLLELGCVFVCRESHQPLLKDVDSKWVVTGNQHINAQIVL